MPIATTEPMTTIHQGIEAGRLNESNRPVTTAERLPSVHSPFIMNFWMRYSTRTQLAMAIAVTRSTSQPNTVAETTRAGSRAIITSRMIFCVDSGPWTCGEGATKSLFAIVFFFC